MRKADKELTNLTVAVASGDAPQTLTAAIRERERQKRDAETEFRALAAGPQLRKGEADVRREALRLLATGAACLGETSGRPDSCSESFLTVSGSSSIRWAAGRRSGMTWGDAESGSVP